MLSKEQIKTIQRTHLTPASPLPRVFSVLGDTTRWHIFHLLTQYEDLCVTDLANILQVSVPAISQHLKIMEMSGLVKKKRMGQMTCYQIERSKPAVQFIVRLVKSFTPNS